MRVRMSEIDSFVDGFLNRDRRIQVSNIVRNLNLVCLFAKFWKTRQTFAKRLQSSTNASENYSSVDNLLASPFALVTTFSTVKPF